MPEEQYFVHNLIIKFRLYNWILWRDLGKILAGELITSLETHWWNFDTEAIIKKIVLSKGDDRSLTSIIDRIFRAYALQQNSSPTIWGDSTPPLVARYAKEIYGAYPDAKYIFLVRDARDVVASFKKGGDHIAFMHLQNHVGAAENWVNVYKASEWVKKRSKNFMIVTYEELVGNRQEVLNSIFSFLEMSPFVLPSDTVHFPDNKFYQLPYHTNLKNPVNTKSIGKYKNELTPKEIDEIMPIIEKPMKQLGYL